MSIKLVTIGDSISQGFMNGAAANTELSYSTILAETMKVTGYHFLNWPSDYKFKCDLENVMRTLEKEYGTDIRGLEWAGALKKINAVLDKSEGYFERGNGKIGNSLNLPYDGFHNLAVEGMDVGDAWLVTPRECKREVTSEKRKDNLFKGADKPFYRNAFRVLNPNAKDKYMGYSAIDWLKHHAEEKGVENTILFLGANNALGTVLDLKIKQTPGDGVTALNASRSDRQSWNLWHPRDFEAEYRVLIDKTLSSLANNKHPDWKCYVGTIPYVTIAPIAKGIGDERVVKDEQGNDCRYYQYYTYFPLSYESAMKTGKFLKFDEALLIDRSIMEFNKIIKKLTKETNKKLGRDAFLIVDLAETMSKMAWKRNSGNPTYEFPEYFKWLHPTVNTKYYHSDPQGNIQKGGIFGLDGVHPTAIGQGLLAWEFLKKMQEHGDASTEAEIEWSKVFANDTLRQKPIRLMHEIYQHDKLIQFFSSALGILNKKD